MRTPITPAARHASTPCRSWPSGCARSRSPASAASERFETTNSASEISRALAVRSAPSHRTARSQASAAPCSPVTSVHMGPACTKRVPDSGSIGRSARASVSERAASTRRPASDAHQRASRNAAVRQRLGPHPSSSSSALEIKARPSASSSLPMRMASACRGFVHGSASTPSHQRMRPRMRRASRIAATPAAPASKDMPRSPQEPRSRQLAAESTHDRSPDHASHTSAGSAIAATYQRRYFGAHDQTLKRLSPAERSRHDVGTSATPASARCALTLSSRPMSNAPCACTLVRLRKARL